VILLHHRFDTPPELFISEQVIGKNGAGWGCFLYVSRGGAEKIPQGEASIEAEPRMIFSATAKRTP
jgi:hypothetical protein